MLGSELRPVHFPDQACVPESKRHLELRTLLYQFLQLAFAQVAAIGCDQFVYWDPRDARACLAPDAFVRFGAPDDLFRSWKVWERGAPQVAVEVISDSDQPSWEEKLARYRRLGVSELVWFNPELPEQPLRVWDFVGDDLLERRLLEPWARSHHLGGYWVVTDKKGVGLTLRLSHDEAGTRLFPTLAEREAEGRKLEAEGRKLEAEGRKLEAEGRKFEAEQRKREALGRKLEAEEREREAQRADAEAAGRQSEAHARRVAEQRVLELEAELRRRS